MLLLRQGSGFMIGARALRFAYLVDRGARVRANLFEIVSHDLRPFLAVVKANADRVDPVPHPVQPRNRAFSALSLQPEGSNRSRHRTDALSHRA